MYPTVTLEGARLQSDITNTKCRWDRASNRDFDTQGNEVTPKEDLDPKPIDEILEENQSREMFNHQTKTLNFRNLRPTEVKNNPRTHLPKPRSTKEEAEFMTRDTLTGREFKEYIDNNKPGVSVTQGELRGIEKLKKRIGAGTLVICETDKSGKLTPMTPEVYTKLGEVHTKGDKTVTWSDVQAAQRLLKGHLRIINHIFNPGADSGAKERVWSAKELKSTVLPVNSLLVKDHKPLNEEGLPKTRPVCGVSCSMDGEILRIWL